MNTNNVENYGWTTPEGPHSCGYITPKILSTLHELGVKRVLDLGAGNGNICFELSNAGFDVVGVKYDKEGVSIAREN